MTRYSTWTTFPTTCRTASRLVIGLALFAMTVVTPTQGVAAANAPFQLAYIPRDAVLVFAVRPATLLQREAVVPLREAVNQLGREGLGLDVQPAEVAEVTVILLPGQRNEPAIAVILRTTTAEAARRFIARVAPDAEPQKFGGQTYQRDRSRASYFQPDGQTVVFAPHEPTLRRCLAAGEAGATTTNWASRWGTVATQDAAAVANTSLLRAADFSQAAEPLGAMLDNRSPMALWQLAPLWQRSEHILADLQVSREVALRIVCQSASEDEARQVHSALLTAIATLRSILSRGRAEVAGQEDTPAPLLLQSIDLMDEILEKAQVVRKEQHVGVVARMNEDTTRSLTKLVPPAAVAARQSSSRNNSMNNLKQLAIAMQNYHDVYKRFPAAVQLGPKNTPRSWRVTILPFIEQNTLYEEYRQDEPWDSENNKRVLAAMPDVYRCPLDEHKSTNASYFTLVGRDTAFPPDRAARFADIVDGTANTLMVVESKQATPWTKPEDIPFDAEKPVPKLGGWHPDGFCAALCDGSALFFPRAKLDDRTLQFLIIRNDGNAIQVPR